MIKYAGVSATCGVHSCDDKKEEGDARLIPYKYILHHAPRMFRSQTGTTTREHLAHFLFLAAPSNRLLMQRRVAFETEWDDGFVMKLRYFRDDEIVHPKVARAEVAANFMLMTRVFQAWIIVSYKYPMIRRINFPVCCLVIHLTDKICLFKERSPNEVKQKLLA